MTGEEGIIGFEDVSPGERDPRNAYLGLVTRLEAIDPILKNFFDDRVNRRIDEMKFQKLLPQKPTGQDITQQEGEEAAKYLTDNPAHALRSLFVGAGQDVRRYEGYLTEGSRPHGITTDEINSRLSHAKSAREALQKILPPLPQPTQS